jgi:hypothetical protein
MLEFDRKIDFDRMDCLLGLAFGDALKKCNEIPEVLDLKWSVTSDDYVVASGAPMRAGSYSDTIARILGDFEAQKGRDYRVNLTLLRDGSELDIANPRLVVETFPGYWEGPVILLQLAFFLALLGCGIAALLLVPAAIRLLKLRRNPACPPEF